MRAIIAITATLLLFTGCGGGSATPSKAYEAYRQAVKSGDPAQVRALVAADAAKELNGDDAAGKLKLLAQLMPAKIEIKEEKVSGNAATLKVVSSEKGKPMTGEINLTMEGGTWKVSKESWSMTLELTEDATGIVGTGEPFFTTVKDPPKPQLVLEGHQDTVSAMAFLPDGLRLVSASYGDYSLRLWDLASGKPLAETRSKNRVTGIHVSTDGATLFTADAYKEIKRYALMSDGFGPPESVLREAGDAFAINPAGNLLAATSFKLPVCIWKLPDLAPLKTLPGSEFVRALRFSPDGKTLAGAGEGSAYVTWDTAAWTEKKTALNNVSAQSSVFGLAFSPDSKLLGIGHGDSSVVIVELASRKERMNNFVTDAAALSIAFCPDGKVLASGHQNRNIYLWDATKGQRLLPLNGHKSPITALAFSTDGSMLASGGEDRKIVLWRRGSPSPAAKAALNPPAKTDPSVKGPELSVPGAQNLLKNTSANEGRKLWKTEGEVSIGETGGNPHFVIRYSGTFRQNVTLPPDAAFIVIAARAASERIPASGGITGLPYIYGYFVNKKDPNRFNGYLNANGLRLDAEEKDRWGVVGAVMKLPPETGGIWFMLQQASGGDPQNGSAARFDDVGLYAFPDEITAKEFLKKYRAAANEFKGN
jgi:WD40 repeat protein